MPTRRRYGKRKPRPAETVELTPDVQRARAVRMAMIWRAVKNPSDPELRAYYQRNIRPPAPTSTVYERWQRDVQVWIDRAERDGGWSWELEVREAP